MPSSSFIKSITRHARCNYVSRSVLQYLIYLYLRILFCTYRLKIAEDCSLKAPFNNEGIFYFWHQNLITILYFFYKKRAVGHCVVNTSSEGKIIAFIAKKFGFKVLVADEHRQISSMREIIDTAKMNNRLALAGDGTRGPVFQLQPYITYIATKTNLPLIYLEGRTPCALTFHRSWCKFKIPLPFSQLYVRVHAPQQVQQPSYKAPSCSYK